MILADYHLDGGDTGLVAIAALRERLGPVPALMVTAHDAPEVARACAALGLGPLERDPRFATNALRCENVEALKRLVEDVTLERPRAHWIAVLEAAGVPTGAIQDVAEVMRDPQILARNMVVTIEQGPAGRPLPCAGNPVKMSGLPDPAVLPPAPRLDGDRAAILAWLDAPEG